VILDTRVLLDAAAMAAAGQQYPPSVLYVVGTPIGNLADITLRALHVLSLVDLVACEDTRNSQHLLQHFGLHKRLLAVHEHNENEAAQQVVQALAAGQRVAYISDAGTPGVSDPGARLVRAVAQVPYRVVPIPGASASVTAVSVAGDVASAGFVFLGFLPSKPTARREALLQWASVNVALVLFESPHRIADLAQDMAAQDPHRQVTVGRELSKQFEDIATMPTQALHAWLQGPSRLRGEFVLVWHAPEPQAADTPPASLPEAVTQLLPLLKGQAPVKELARLLAQATGQSRNRLYQALLDCSEP
jgi:16S rRNA (cytidine1402-2'-O)-methyltransferase